MVSSPQSEPPGWVPPHGRGTPRRPDAWQPSGAWPRPGDAFGDAPPRTPHPGRRSGRDGAGHPATVSPGVDTAPSTHPDGTPCAPPSDGPPAPPCRPPGASPSPVSAEPVGRAARRRAARARGRGERGAVRRFLPRALVVACLAGGTSAFVAEDKRVELTVDGESRVLRTFADDVGELLAEEGVVLGAHDRPDPSPETRLTHGGRVSVRHGRPVRLTLDGRRSSEWTTAETVEGALRQLGVRADGAHLSASRSRRIGLDGVALDVRTERVVTVLADGRSRAVRTNAASVGEVVAEAGITLRGEDALSVPADDFPRDGQTVTVLRIRGEREVREEALPFVVRRVPDASLYRGTEVVGQAGRKGLRRTVYTVRVVDGVRGEPREVGSEVVREPRARVVRFGTRARPTSVRGADHLDWRSLAACESGGRPDAVDPSGTYGGLYQFDLRTWRSVGGQGRPQDASPAEQTHRAKRLYLRRGASPWPHCGSRLHG
ncbi:resuscitation-promoting factor [Streptomyces sp. WMMC905]|uniref:ubiquitin-like domain-containing protein n=1 Tax=Streptomyces sp. WMMC905 TaxID=3404123 RepID=UPI0019076150|nr:resuscitation-promoting factor [Streptomyces sp. HSG2]